MEIFFVFFVAGGGEKRGEAGSYAVTHCAMDCGGLKKFGQTFEICVRGTFPARNLSAASLISAISSFVNS